jgi:hypothetical protein
MPWAAITLKPGVNLEATGTALQAGYFSAMLARFRSGFFEKLGGFVKYFAFSIAGVPRAMQAWLDLNQSIWLAIATTQTLDAINNNIIYNISPQQLTSNTFPQVDFDSSTGHATITDPNINNVTVFDSITLNTPISVGNIILSGTYPILSIVSADSYIIDSGKLSPTSVTRITASITNITQANPGVVSAVNDFADNDYVTIFNVLGMTQVNKGIFKTSGTTGSQFNLTGVNTTGYSAYNAGGLASPASLPQFTTSTNSATVTVTFNKHGLVAGNSVVFPIATSVGGVTIQGSYVVLAAPAVTVDTFPISATSTAASTATATMNNGLMEIVYNITQGPVAAGSGYSFGGYGTGTYSGVGGPSGSQQGTAIHASDWTLDAWNDILIACPANGGIYAWEPASGLQQAQLVATAPTLNSGVFIAAPYLILIAYGSTINKNIGVSQDGLTWRASDIADYTYWTTNAINPKTGLLSQAFQSRIPTGSLIVAGLATPNQVLMWTDLDLWSITYVNLPQIWAQAKIGSNCGCVGRHAVGQLNGVVYWVGKSNFYALYGGSVVPIPCNVWDSVFQNLNTSFLSHCWVETITGFNEVMFFYPSASASDGECDSYAKMQVIDGTWDQGLLSRTAGIGQSLLGNPIMGASTGVIYQHEIGYNADNAPLIPSFTTGYFYLTEGEDFCVVDQFIPDFHFQTYSGSTTPAQIQVTFNVINYPNDAAVTYGPYTMTTATEKLDVRFRGRQFSITMTSTDVNSFWRIGKCRFRYAIAGRR